LANDAGCSLVVLPFNIDAVLPLLATAAAAAAISFLEALPRFLRSRAYSQVKPNSVQGLSVFGSLRTKPKKKKEHNTTNAMCAWVLPVAFCPKLITLITCATDSSTDGTGD
jgi:hypothetical protein